MPVAVAIAEAVVAALNGHSFSQPFISERSFLPKFDLKELKTLKVVVVPRGRVLSVADRSRAQQDYAIDIGVLLKLSGTTPGQVDPMISLVEEIADFFRAKRLSDYPAAAWLKTEHNPLYDLEHLDQLRQFTSVMSVTYRFVA
jgi:hypothetical protein